MHIQHAYHGHRCQVLSKEGLWESSLTAQEGEEGQIPLDLFGDVEGLYTYGIFGDRIAGRKARNAERRLATHLASKWKRGYSQMVYYVRVQMAIAVVHANSLLIHGSRDRQQPRRPLIPGGAALGDWQTGQDS
jgi:hypothetical protein